MNVRGKQVPVLVTYRKETGYTLSLAFMPELRSNDMQFERAANKLRRAVRAGLDNALSERRHLDRILWATLSIDFRFGFEDIAFEAGSLRVSGLLAVLHFEIGGVEYACLPMLDALLINVDGTQGYVRTELIISKAQNYFREQRKKLGEKLDPVKHLAQRSDSCMPLDFTIHVNGPKFPFEAASAFFEELRGTAAFDGRTELPRVAQDWNEAYPDELMTAVLRDDWVAELNELLYQQSPGCIALVGPSGCGKTAVLHETLRRHIKGANESNPARLQKMWHIDPLRVISGMSVVGQWQRRMEAIIHYASHRLSHSFSIHKSDHLVCDNMVALFRIGKSSQNSLTLADALRPYLERRELTLIAEATPEEWQKVQEYDRRFAELFRVVRLPAPSHIEAMTIVAWQRAHLEQVYRCTIEGAAVTELLKLTRRFHVAEAMPGPAVRNLGKLAQQFEKEKAGVLDVRAMFQQSHHFREKLFAQDQVFEPGEVEQFLTQRLIGQAEARNALEDVVHLIKAGLSRPGKPLASMLFIGPTGVGKTEAAKVLATMLFGDDPGGLIRFDMNEFVDGTALTRLIGDRHQPDGQVTTAVRQRKACVLLLDEIEKADPAVHDLLLQVLGEGRLTDALGRTTDFGLCVIIMTSNLGAEEATRVTGFVAADNTAPSYKEAVTRFFRPEFLNRIDRQIPFAHLTHAEMMQVARLHIGHLLARDGFVRRLTFLNVDEAMLSALVSSGYDPRFGARSLKRHIERVLTGPTAQKLATQTGDRPMILDVYLDGDGVSSRATVLDFAKSEAQQLPTLQGDPLQAYLQLQDRINALQAQVWENLDDAEYPYEIELRSLQDKLYLLKQRIANSVWHLQERNKSKLRGTIARKQTPRDWYYAGRKELDELISQSDMAAFIDELAQYGERIVEDDPYYLDNLLQLEIWHEQYQSLCEQGLDHICMEIVAHRQIDEAAFTKLWDGYASLFDLLDVTKLTTKPMRRKKRNAEYWVLSGAGLHTLLNGERGVHLWFADHEQAVPMSIHISLLADDEDLSEQAANVDMNYREQGLGNIVRTYHETSSPRQFVVTDLRSSLVRRSTDALTENDWKFLLYHGKL